MVKFLTETDTKTTQKQPKWLFFFLTIVITLGVIFRFTNLSLKPYWIDESYTLLRASGYTAKEANEELYAGKVIAVSDILKYQEISSESSIIGTIEGLASEEPQHPPFYFLLTRLWGQIFGTSKVAMRSLPVFCSLLAFPAIYWLCLELFASPVTGWMTMALYSVSPIFLRYAQEVRQYSLWLTFVTLSSAALLKAIRKPTKLNWIIYTSTIIISLYCQPITVLIIAAHGIYIAIRGKFRLNKKLISYFLSSIVSIMSFFPWLSVILSRLDTIRQTTWWMSIPLPFETLIKFWSISLNRTFLALHLDYNQVLFYCSPLILLLIIYAFYFLYRNSSSSIWVFIFSLTGTAFVPFLIYDLLEGGRRSTNERFFLPCYLGIYLAISFLLINRIANKKGSVLWRRLWQGITAIILISSLAVCGSSSLASTWWGWSEHDVRFSKIIEQEENPLVISDSPFYAIAPFSHQLDLKTSMLLLPQPTNMEIPSNFSNVFFYAPSQALLSKLKQDNLKVKEVDTFEDTLTSFQVSLYKLEG